MAKKTDAQLQRDINEALSKERHHAKKKSPHGKAAPPFPFPLGPPRSKAAKVIVYSRPSGYWYAQARDAMTGAQITDASGYSREDVLGALRGKFAMMGVKIKSISDEDPYEAPRHATKKSARPDKQLTQAAKRANDQIYDLVNNKYFQSIPNDQLFKIVRDAGFRFDPEEEEFILVGRDGKATWQLHDASGRAVNHALVLQWHKLDRTGRFEVVAYVS
jgi:hypothetical protein